MKKTGITLALVLAASHATANDIPTKIFGAYYVPSAKAEVQDTPNLADSDDSGSAYGLFAEIGTDTPIGYVFGYGQHEIAAIDFDYQVNASGQQGEQSSDITESRLGAGLRHRFGKSAVSVSLGYFELNEEHEFEAPILLGPPGPGTPTLAEIADGVHGSHLQFSGEHLLTLIGGKAPLLAWADVGFMDLNEADATEFRGGLKAMLAPNVGAILSYRHFEMERNDGDNDGQTVTLSGPNLGLSLMF